jgi:hypothetical protein
MRCSSSTAASSQITSVFDATSHTVVTRLASLLSWGTRVHTMPDAFATSTAATRSNRCS